jgi:hypothetical protein
MQCNVDAIFAAKQPASNGFLTADACHCQSGEGHLSAGHLAFGGQGASAYCAARSSGIGRNGYGHVFSPGAGIHGCKLGCIGSGRRSGLASVRFALTMLRAASRALGSSAASSMPAPFCPVPLSPHCADLPTDTSAASSDDSALSVDSIEVSTCPSLRLRRKRRPVRSHHSPGGTAASTWGSARVELSRRRTRESADAALRRSDSELTVPCASTADRNKDAGRATIDRLQHCTP